MTPQTRLLFIANNRNAKSNFELIERLQLQVNTSMPTTILLDPNAKQELTIKKHVLYDASIESDAADSSSER